MDGPYALQGIGASKPSFSTSSSKLVVTQSQDGCTVSGVQSVLTTTKRCSKKTCRTHHHYNYRKVEGEKLHRLPLEDVQYVFVNSKLGFSSDFLDYHNALQFRSGINRNAIEFAQAEVLWQDSHQHFRCHRECTAVQLYYLVLQEASEMWASSQNSVRNRLLSIKIEDPPHADFLETYSSWLRFGSGARSKRS